MNIEIFNILTLFLISFFPATDTVNLDQVIDIPNPINLIDNLVLSENNLFDVRRRGGSSFGGSKSYSGFSKPKKKKSFDLDDAIEDALEDDDDEENNILPIFLILLFMLFIIYTFMKTKKSSNG